MPSSGLKGGEYEATFLGLMNHVSGEATAIERLSASSAHYFQRPDRGYSRIDATRTSMNGYKAIAGFERRSGRHWLWDTRDHGDLSRTGDQRHRPNADG